VGDVSLPHDDDAERALLATLITDPGRVTDVMDLVDAGSFFRPSNSALFETIRDLRVAGQLNGWGSAEVLAAEMRRRGHEATATDLAVLGSEADMHHRQHAQVVQRYAYARQAARVGQQIVDMAKEAAQTPDELVHAARDAVAGLEAPVTFEHLQGLWTVDGLVDSPHHQSTRWLIPGVLGEQWRVLIVAPEGAGKSYLTRMIAAAAAQGMHPFMVGEEITPVPTLVVDLENPEDVIAQGFRQVTDQTRKKAGYDAERSWVWSQPGGIDIRRRTDRARLEAVIAATAPRIVSIGPLYKLYLTSARESDEMVAREVIGILDEIRVRFDLALLVEHHAPKGDGHGKRNLNPFGSSLWTRWPELGLSLEPDENQPGALWVKRHRFDRTRNNWPTRLERGKADDWPFVADWTRRAS
jgi:hypothetical protein